MAKTLVEQVIALNPSDLEDLFRIAEIYQQLGERELALHWLSIVISKGYSLTRIYKNPLFSDIRSDQRFRQIIKDREQNITTGTSPEEK